jgi:DNA-binding Lrp family transcriptional regulator
MAAKKPDEQENLIQIDEKDRKILAILAKNSRETLVNIAKEVRMSVDGTRMRTKRLVDSGVITGFTILRSYKKLGYSLKADILVKLQNLTEEKISGFIGYLKKCPQVIVLNSIAGDFDIEIAVIARSSSELAKFSKDIRIKFSDIIVDWKVNIITESHKVEEFEI